MLLYLPSVGLNRFPVALLMTAAMAAGCARDRLAPLKAMGWQAAWAPQGLKLVFSGTPPATSAEVLRRLGAPLDIRLTGVDRIPDFLATLPSVSALDLRATAVSDLSPLRRLTSLTRLDLRFTRVDDLSPLADLHELYGLDLNSTRVSSIAPIANLTKLSGLDLSSTSVSDLGPLKDLVALKTLSLFRAPVADLSPLRGLTNLSKLDLS